jgi:predicted peptidase
MTLAGSPRRIIILISILLTTLYASARVQTGFLDRTVEISGKSYRYQVYVPVDLRSKKSWPVILFLHGSGERGSDGLIQTNVGLPTAIRLNRSRFPFVVVIPQCSADKNWSTPDQQSQAMAALDASIKEFHGDRNRIYLTGLSMGGYGVWQYAIEYPGRFAALVPICGGIRPPSDESSLAVKLPGDSKDVASPEVVARLIGKTPVWIFHGGADDSVPVEESRHMAAALKTAGANFKYTEYPGVGHNSWDKAYAEPDLVPWLLAQALKGRQHQ